MHALRQGEVDLLSFLGPDTLVGALIYLVLFILGASWDGRMTVLPNSVAASQVTISHCANPTPFPMKVEIGIGRDAVAWEPAPGPTLS